MMAIALFVILFCFAVFLEVDYFVDERKPNKSENYREIEHKK